MNSTCLFCNETILDTDLVSKQEIYYDGIKRKSHVECAFRSVTGGIGHWMDHEKFCLQQHDSDAGFSWRQSARLAYAYYSMYKVLPDMGDIGDD